MSTKIRLAAYIVLTFAVGACRFAATPRHVVQDDSGPHRTYAAGIAWTQSGWKDGPGFSAADAEQGYAFGGGVEVSPDGSLALSRVTAAARTINEDLNNDGYTDIIVANSGNYEFIDAPFAQIRHQNDDHALADAQIYWGGPDGYDEKRTTPIPGDRPSSLAAMDFNLDGILDLAVAGGGEFHPPYVNSRIYWGTRHGFDKENCTLLPTNASTGTAAGDFNKDGYPDVVFANLGDYNFPFPPSLVYWGGPQGFSPTNRTELETHGVGGLAVNDLNNDGWLDIAFSNSAGFPPVEELMDYGQNYPWPDSYIYLGGPEGFSKERRISLKTKGATGVKIADLNKDGQLDIVFANAGSFALPPLPDTYVYWGSPEGYSESRRTDLRTNGASAVSVSDLNKDKWPDLILSVTGTYLYIGKPSFPNSFVYWGGPDGFSDDHRIALNTEGSQGNTITDVNMDGNLDICFSQLGDFNQPYRPTLVYYGSGGTRDAFYSSEKMRTLPGKISYGSIVVGPPDGGDHMSHGNLAIPPYERTDAYVNEGRLVSSTHYSDDNPEWKRLSYAADVPEGTQAVLVVEGREVPGGEWKESGRVELASGQHGVALKDAGVRPSAVTRYSLILKSLDGRQTPVVRSVEFQ